MNVHGRNGRQDLATPRWLVGEICKLALRKWGEWIQHDVCAHPDNAIVPSFFTEDEDGLVQPWPEYCFCNPPFSEIPAWLAKADYERRRVVFLLPAKDLQVRWVREHQHRYQIEMITPRVNYLDWRVNRIVRGVSFPSMLWWRLPGVRPDTGEGKLSFTYRKLRAPKGAT